LHIRPSPASPITAVLWRSSSPPAVTRPTSSRPAPTSSPGSSSRTAASGDANVECWTEGDFELLTASADQGWVGDLIYAVDNYMVDKTSASQTLVGRCVGFVSATRIIVRIQVNAT
jgi:predicted RecA/RadA family phage recombinase